MESAAAKPATPVLAKGRMLHTMLRVVDLK